MSKMVPGKNGTGLNGTS